MMVKQPLLIVAGPTASGKTALAVQLAKAFDAEVISADSMQVYRDISIGTARPTPEEMDGVPHHLVGFLSLSETFSVADFAQLAREKICEIAGRGRLPLVAGGTGLYLSALVDHLDFDSGASDPDLRRRLEEEAACSGAEALLERLRALDPDYAAQLHPHNLKRLIRALELALLTGKTRAQREADSRREESPYQPILLGIAFENRQLLYERIDRRVDQMLSNGLVEEARLVLHAGASQTALQAIGYKELFPYLLGKEPLETAAARLKQESRRYAKRQMTWMRRMKGIHWLYRDQLGGEQALFKAARDVAAACLAALEHPGTPS